ncbi:hypothetical protein UFOVP529_66 [uncultured Caudovirales phage]|uniref:Uncharacterized protein n=1 Tax=uncultured Caudovirales phage TaxID=2100421 RepID=A0A6J5MRA9_9CAUD|nr:hypothetical protein UFOVP529_66 [uncultured Caudovirales phage]CAB4189557.1 hypothetical protein UFOVP1191_4 [uncultured Caudovirales phage]CAB4194427.1 hypothetical protein UFOVP1252_55 [uncultured Caudovirales phage]
MAYKDTWEKGKPAPRCPNNPKHGLRPDPRGGHVCDSCVEELAGTRSRDATRWAFADLPLDAGADTE